MNSLFKDNFSRLITSQIWNQCEMCVDPASYFLEWIFTGEFWIFTGEFWIFNGEFWIFNGEFWIFNGEFWIFNGEFWMLVNQRNFLTQQLTWNFNYWFFGFPQYRESCEITHSSFSNKSSSYVGEFQQIYLQIPANIFANS